MIELPAATELNKRIPKQKFYENSALGSAHKKAFSAQIKSIRWRNKIAPDVMRLAAGKEVHEIEVFEILLNDPQIDEAILRQIDRTIPYHILFFLVWEKHVRAAIAYKETADAKGAAARVERYYYTDWMAAEDLSLRLEGLSMDAVYENFVRQIAGTALDEQSASLKDSVAAQGHRERLSKQIAALEAKIRREKRPKKKFELVQELTALQRNLLSKTL